MSARAPLMNKSSKSLLKRFSKTGKWTVLPWPEMLTLSHTTDTWVRKNIASIIHQYRSVTSQKKVSLSLGRSPLVSSMRKSLLINFLNPQSLPWTNLNQIQRNAAMKKNLMNLKIPVGPLTLHGLGLFFLGVQNAELELGSHFGLVTRD